MLLAWPGPSTKPGWPTGPAQRLWLASLALAPRQQVVISRNAQPEVDVWAVAACFYSMVAGESPRDFPADQNPWTVA